MFVNELFESKSRRVVVVYPGRFQPWHKGHLSVYNKLVSTYGFENVYISTSNKTEYPRSPFEFSDKLRMMNVTGVDSSRVIKSVQPYRSQELVNILDPENTILLFAVSEKDMGSDPRFTFEPKRDGSPSYFQPVPDSLEKAESMNTHAYITTVPTQEFKVLNKPVTSATELRAIFAAANEETKKMIIADLFGKYDDELYQMMASKIVEQRRDRDTPPPESTKTPKPDPTPSRDADSVDQDVSDKDENGEEQVDPKVAFLNRKAQIAHPYAKTPTEALALYILNREQEDVERLEASNKKYEEAIDRLLELESTLEVKLADLQQQIDVINNQVQATISEEAAGVGVVAKNSKMAKDPRYSMSMTKDVRPGATTKNMKALRLK